MGIRLRRTKKSNAVVRIWDSQEDMDNNLRERPTGATTGGDMVCLRSIDDSIGARAWSGAMGTDARKVIKIK